MLMHVVIVKICWMGLLIRGVDRVNVMRDVVVL